MEQSGLIESDYKILGVTKSCYLNKNSAWTFCYNLVGAVGREHLSSSEVGRGIKSLRTTGRTMWVRSAADNNSENRVDLSFMWPK